MRSAVVVASSECLHRCNTMTTETISDALPTFPAFSNAQASRISSCLSFNCPFICAPYVFRAVPFRMRTLSLHSCFSCFHPHLLLRHLRVSTIPPSPSREDFLLWCVLEKCSKAVAGQVPSLSTLSLTTFIFFNPRFIDFVRCFLFSLWGQTIVGHRVFCPVVHFLDWNRSRFFHC